MTQKSWFNLFKTINKDNKTTIFHDANVFIIS